MCRLPAQAAGEAGLVGFYFLFFDRIAGLTGFYFLSFDRIAGLTGFYFYKTKDTKIHLFLSKQYCCVDFFIKTLYYIISLLQRAYTGTLRVRALHALFVKIG